MTLERKEFGAAAEAEAAKYLEKNGFSIVERNYRTKLGEIDLIAKKKDLLVFVEVKAGRNSPGFSPVDHFNVQKQRKCRVLAQAYLARLKVIPEVRFDLIAITKTGEDLQVDHFEDVIQDPSP